MNRELIYDLLRLSLSDGEGNLDFSGVSHQDWQWAFSVLSMHGVAAFVCEGLDKMPQEARPPKDVLLRFISANMNGQKDYARLKALAQKICGLVSEAGEKCLLLKGLSLAEYYPKPQARKFLDVDLYAPGAEIKVDEAFRAKGVVVDTEFYRHSHMTVGGVLVENHHCLLDVRGRRRLAELDADLKNMALKHLEGFPSPGLYYPDARFSLIFNLHHAMSHFIYEGISFKFLVDWILFLRREKELLTTDQTAASLREHGLLKFAAVMSEVSVRHLGLAMEDVPECVRAEMALLKPAVVDKFIDDLFRPYEQIHQKNIIAERLHSVRRIVRAAWKPKEFLGQSAVVFVWGKFLPILMGRKFEAD
ncbi:MAG: hypothetical protein E7111_00035 [Bacteroidales bacterium]|nr:hypothetical protein [Bacteroidales bacterium]